MAWIFARWTLLPRRSAPAVTHSHSQVQHGSGSSVTAGSSPAGSSTSRRALSSSRTMWKISMLLDGFGGSSNSSHNVR
jgi:hypothetical protein